MAKRVVIFCEGEDNGMDSKVLNKLFEQVGITYHDVRPMGGKKCAKAIVDSFIRSEYKASQVVKAFFLRDRDFDYGFSISQKLDPGKLSLSEGREIAFGRSMIENYLLDAELFFKFSKTIPYPNARNTFNSIEEVEQLFIEVAKGLAFHQAMRFAFATFSQKVRDERYESKKIDKLVTTANYNLPFLQITIDSVCDEIYKIEETISDNYLSNFKADVDKQYKLFDNSFYVRKDFLIAFSGKFLGKAISSRTGIIMEDYYKFAVDNTDFTKFPDFIELVDLIK